MPNSGTLTAIHSFSGTDGAWSRGSLTLSNDGVLYGRTSLGGANNTGTVFSFDPSGQDFKLLYSFTSSHTDGKGMMPHHNAMTLAGNTGNTLWGAALYGGNEDNPQPPDPSPPPPPPSYKKKGNGTLFSIQTDGSGFTPLHAFSGWGHHAKDGALPHSPFWYDSNHRIGYGMTSNGGAKNQGTLYSLDFSHTPPGFKLLYSFDQGSGSEPHGMVTPDRTGSYLLGMTRHGGSSHFGVIFCYELGTNEYTPLHSFAGREGGDGATNDHGFVTPVTSGDTTTYYGVTSGGGLKDCGVIFSFQFSSTGSSPVISNYTVLYNFQGESSDGAQPYGSLTLVNAMLYGTTTQGGANNWGTVFSFDPASNAYAVLASFDARTTGAYPEDCLTPNADGTVVYGLTQAGGAHDPECQNYYGTVFALTLPTS